MAKSNKKSPKKTEDKKKNQELPDENQQEVVDETPKDDTPLSNEDNTKTEESVDDSIDLESSLLDEQLPPAQESSDESTEINWDDFSFDDDFLDDTLDSGSETEAESPIDMSQVTDSFNLDDSETAEVFTEESTANSKDEMAMMLDDKLEEIKEFVDENKLPVQIGGGVLLLILLYLIFSPSNDSSQLNEITKVTEQATSIDNELKRFEAEFSQISVDGNNKLVELDGKVNVLFESMKENKEELAAQRQSINELTTSLKQLIVQRKSGTHAQKQQKQSLYTITAIVPGRVWLQQDDGNEFTATVGDHLKELGVITKIEPNYGRVMTSSGVVIYLGVNDG